EVRASMGDLVPDDTAFRQAFASFGAITTTRAKYILARLERQHLADKGESTEAMPDWSSKAVSVEHVFARSSKRDAFDTDDDFDRFASVRDQLQNLTLLERTLNAGLEDKPFSEKRPTYRESAFALTRELGEYDNWDFDATAERAHRMADLAVRAWP